MALLAIDWKPSARQLRTFGVVAAAVLSVLAAWAMFRRSLFGVPLSPTAAQQTAVVGWITGGACLLASLLLPKALWPLYVGLNAVAFPIGFVLSHVILFAIFYLVFTPVALVFRLIGRDVLHRRFEPDADSYWSPRDPHPPAGRYFRQF
ncbi:MAG: SxtJ family membrane protein [Planctomycetota bacterium]|nr:SxtJ family membrane protein [Planctomycetota bacterium]